MDLALRMEIEETLDDLLQNGSQYSLVLNPILTFNLDDIDDGACPKEWHYQPEIRIVYKRNEIADHILVPA